MNTVLLNRSLQKLTMPRHMHDRISLAGALQNPSDSRPDKLDEGSLTSRCLSLSLLTCLQKFIRSRRRTASLLSFYRPSTTAFFGTTWPISATKST